ncbi:hypothetical protein RS694_19715 [Rhodoferax saidenbachensis]|uniref:Uncharacterized protein n=2 Tax=Rhodoferax saidenbachensis TaxID=1484693 RepID=A0A1P8KEY4_9BURK|nr:hypothetical protein RS694_19715 [Rhodoferax saidenbachensis]
MIPILQHEAYPEIAPIAAAVLKKQFHNRFRECIDMDIRKIFLAAMTLSAISVSAQSPTDLPPKPNNPQLAAAFEQAQALLVKARDPAFMSMSVTNGSWPCNVPNLELRKLAGALSDNEDDAGMKRLKRLSSVNLNMRQRVQVKDVQIVPIKATCKNGKLDGPLEFMMELTRVLDTAAGMDVSEMRTRSRHSMTLSAGQYLPGAPLTVVSSQVSMKRTSKNPAVQAQMNAQPTADVKPPLTAFVQYQSEEKFAATTVSISEVMMAGAKSSYFTSMHEMTDGRNGESRSYMGGTLTTITPTKNGLMHGESRGLPYKMGSFDVPPSPPVCYEEGEVILASKCEAN